MQQKQRGRFVGLAIAVAILITASACSQLEPDNSADTTDVSASSALEATSTPSTSTSAPPLVAPPDGMSTADLVQYVQASVVRVAIPSGVGSGFIIDPDGYIITNHHVIEDDPNRVAVTLADGSVHQSALVGMDPESDLAVLKIDVDRALPALELAELRDVTVGQDVVAIGFALDLTGGNGPPSVTRGIVSAKNRVIQPRNILGAVQTDTAINHGNSGGPLLDYSGRVVGVNTALAPDTTGGVAQNIGFAVGSDTVRAVYDEIRTKGQVERALLGIRNFSSLRAAQARALGVPEGTKGIVLGSDGLMPGGPAAAAGLQPQDVIVRVGNNDVADESDLAVAMINLDPGNSVELQFYRDGALESTTITLGTP